MSIRHAMPIFVSAISINGLFFALAGTGCQSSKDHPSLPDAAPGDESATDDVVTDSDDTHGDGTDSATMVTDSETTDTRTTDTETTDTETTDTQTTDTRTSDTETSDTQTTDTETSDTRTSDTRTSDTETSDTGISDSGGTDNGDTDTDPEVDPASLFIEPPALVLIESSDRGDTSITATFRDFARTPYTEVQFAALAPEGACRRLTYRPSSCDPPCEGFCVNDGECIENSSYLSAGDLSFLGLTEEVTVAPVELSEGVFTYAVSFDHSLTNRNVPVTVAAKGASFDAFTLTADAPLVPLVMTVPGVIHITEGVELIVSWEPAGDGSRMRINLNSDSAGHGTFHPSVIECDVPEETGSLRVPQDLVDAHADSTNWSCGFCLPSIAYRYHRATAEISGVTTALEIRSISRFDTRP